MKVAPFRSPVMADDEHIYPFSSATAIVHHECREDGDPPLARVSANHRCPCIVFSLYGGKFMTDASGAGEGQKEGGLDRVVCYISFGSMHIQTLAAQLNSADGSFRISDEFVFGLNSKQLQMVEGPHLRIQCFKLAKDQPSSTASFDVPVEQAKKTLIGCVEVDIRRLVCSPTPEVDKVVGGVDWGADGMITGYLRDAGKKNEDIFHRDGMGQLHRARLFFRCKSKPAGQDGDCAHVLSSDMWAPPALPDMLNDVASAGTRARDRTGANDARDVCIAVMAASNGADGRSMSHGCNKAKGTKDSMQVSAADRTNERVSEEHSEDTESVSSTESDSVQTVSADIEGVLGVGGGWGQEHWRERLDKTMDSLAVSAAVIALVVLDVVLAVVYDLSSSTQTTLHATAEFKVGRFGADSLMIRTPPPRPPTHTLTHSHTYTHTHTFSRSLLLNPSGELSAGRSDVSAHSARSDSRRLPLRAYTASGRQTAALLPWRLEHSRSHRRCHVGAHSARARSWCVHACAHAGSGVSSRETDELSGGKTATTSVRVASRIAMGLHLLPVLVNALVHILAHVCRCIHTLARSLAHAGLRLLRVLVNLRKARRFDVKVKGRLRSLVSQNRRR